MIRMIDVAMAAALLLSAGTAFAAEKTVTLKVDNMTCASCPVIVKGSLAKVDGVSAAKVSFEKKTATVTFDDAKTNVAALVAATTNAGYPSKVAP
jgi:mercuric ion binding protein